MTRLPRHALGTLALLGVLACNEPAPPPPAAPARPLSNNPPAPAPAPTEPEPDEPPDDRPPPPPLELGHAIDPEAPPTTGPANPDGPAPGVQPGSASTAALPGAIDRSSALPPEASAGPLPGPPPPTTPDHE
jgi:hypothetical protein